MKKKIRIATLSVMLIAVLGIFFNSCDDSEGVATRLQLLSGGDQTGIVETPLTSPVEVVVADQNHIPFAGVTVNFETTDGTVSGATAVTDSLGKASVTWTLGATVGTQTLTVTAFKSDDTTALTGSPLIVTAIGELLTVTDIDGNVYQTVKIGDQTWMAENLKVTKYPNGDPIPHITDNGEWSSLNNNNIDDAYCFYGNDLDSAYGAFYTWSAAMGDNAVSSDTNPSGVQGVCPNGWHLPSDAEWTELTNYLGGDNVAGGKMKTNGLTQWLIQNTGASNESGFSALPSGIRYYYNGQFAYLGSSANFWTASELGLTFSSTRSLSGASESIDYLKVLYKSTGASVRCVMD